MDIMENIKYVDILVVDMEFIDYTFFFLIYINMIIFQTYVCFMMMILYHFIHL